MWTNFKRFCACLFLKETGAGSVPCCSSRTVSSGCRRWRSVCAGRSARAWPCRWGWCCGCCSCTGSSLRWPGRVRPEPGDKRNVIRWSSPLSTSHKTRSPPCTRTSWRPGCNPWTWSWRTDCWRPGEGCRQRPSENTQQVFSSLPANKNRKNNFNASFWWDQDSYYFNRKNVTLSVNYCFISAVRHIEVETES